MPSAPPRQGRLSPELLARTARYAARVAALERLQGLVQAAPLAEVQPGEDALHDFRVALRRLRTWLDAMTPALEDTVGQGTLRRLRRLSRHSGLARDLEVQIASLTRPPTPFRTLAAGAAGDLADRIRMEQSAALEEALEAIGSELPRARRKLEKQLRHFEVRVRLDPSQGDPSMAVVMAGLLREGVERLGAAMTQVTSADRADEAHEARLAVKHLRYLAEVLAGTHRRIRRAVHALAGLQDALGLLHDRHLLLARIDGEIDARGSRRPLNALRNAVRGAAEREFRRVSRVARGQTLTAALAGIGKVATALDGDATASLPTHQPEIAVDRVLR